MFHLRFLTSTNHCRASCGLGHTFDISTFLCIYIVLLNKLFICYEIAYTNFKGELRRASKIYPCIPLRKAESKRYNGGTWRGKN